MPLGAWVGSGRAGGEIGEGEVDAPGGGVDVGDGSPCRCEFAQLGEPGGGAGVEEADDLAGVEVAVPGGDAEDVADDRPEEVVVDDVGLGEHDEPAGDLEPADRVPAVVAGEEVRDAVAAVASTDGLFGELLQPASADRLRERGVADAQRADGVSVGRFAFVG